MSDEVWILGATGRSGRSIAAQLLARGVTPVLVGRDAARLQAVATQVAGARAVVAGSVAAMGAEIRRQQPAVVVHTVGPFAATAVPIAQACLPASSYLDLGNDVIAASGVLALHRQAVATGRTLVTGAGFGVLATESVVVALCEGRGPAAQVRTDMVPSLELEPGVLGESLAATILDGLPHGGRRYEHGQLVRARVGGDATRLVLPDGSTVTTAGMPLGELVAAQRASRAPSAVAASSEAPTGPAVRVVLPVASALLSIAPLRAFAKRRLAQIKIAGREAPRQHSWAHAHVTWPDGSTREGWLRLGSASLFTAATSAEVAARLLTGQGRPGAYTPAALFGPSLAEICGGELLMTPSADPPR
jgi:short subunit dehydrogenase-like uncharacterized protein